MNTLQLLLQEAEHLNMADLQWLVHRLIDKLVNKQEKVITTNFQFFDQYCGIAPDFWGIDAQTYINELRNDDRF